MARRLSPKKRRQRDARLNRGADSSMREDRAFSDRELTQDRILTDEERLDEFRMSMFQSALPDLPQIEGYHVCWLTTTNPRDSIPARMRLGYQPIQQHEIPGWEHAAIKSGEYEGMVGVNEMVAFKLPLHLYEAYMYHAHHEAPLEEEGVLEDQRRQAIETAAAVNSRAAEALHAEDANEELGEAPEPPGFEETLRDRTRYV